MEFEEFNDLGFLSLKRDVISGQQWQGLQQNPGLDKAMEDWD